MLVRGPENDQASPVRRGPDGDLRVVFYPWIARRMQEWVEGCSGLTTT